MITKNSLLVLILLVSGSISFAQSPKYWVQFTDKSGSPYSISQPEEFLSQRAIDRRERQGIAIEENDLPINPAYKDSVIMLGATIVHGSKWFNALTITDVDATQLAEIAKLSFVKQMEQVSYFKKPYDKYYRTFSTEPGVIGGKGSNPIERPGEPGGIRNSESKSSKVKKPKKEKKSKRNKKEKVNGNSGSNTNAIGGFTPTALAPSDLRTEYGTAENQITMLNGDFLHYWGYQGEGMIIALMDAGFRNVNNNPAFERMFDEGRLLGTIDFVSGGDSVYDDGTHGAWVLSTIAGELKDQYKGTAVNASFYLFRTEDEFSELIIEEDNWIAAAEWADSAGVDVFNTSLSYNTFDSLTDRSYEDMDGNTARITIAADIAASKGILVVNSAGNEGNDPWYYIAAPADGDSVITVGSVMEDRKISGFSSHGPTYDGRIKPNTCAQGTATALIDHVGTVGVSNGTSFSSPIIAGLAACLWQAFPNKTNIEIMRAIEQSSHMYDDPDDDYGYGIADFKKAFWILEGSIDSLPEKVEAGIQPNPFTNTAEVYFKAWETGDVYAYVFDNSLGQVLQSTYLTYVEEGEYYKFRLDDLNNLAAGLYQVCIGTSDSGCKMLPVVKY